MLSATEIGSASTIKRLVVEQGRFLKREKKSGSCKFQLNCKLQSFILKLRAANYEINFELQVSKKFAESSFETASCSSFFFKLNF